MSFIKTLMSSALLLATFCTSASPAGDPSKSYSEAAARIRAEVAAMPFPEFSIRKVPEAYHKESQVILAEYSSIKAGAGRRKGWLSYTDMQRQLVALQDEAAVKAWSEQTFTEFNSRNTWYGKLETRVIVGIRVLKPDGRVSEINPDEDEVHRKYSIGQKVRMAIPDLQPGDLLDVYAVREFEGEPANFRMNHYQYVLNTRLPVLNKRIECETGRDFALEYHNINGAPPFEAKEISPGNWKLSFFADSITRRPQLLSFVNEKRQFPVLQLNVMRGDIAPYTSHTRRQPGTLRRDPSPDRFVWEALIRLSDTKQAVLGLGGILMRTKSPGVTTFYDSLTRTKREFDIDSLAGVLYYMYRYDYTLSLLKLLNATQIANLPLYHNPEVYHYLLAEYLKLHKINAEMVIASPLREPPLKDMVDSRDFTLLATIPGNSDVFFGGQALYAPAFCTDERVEGVHDALAVDTKGARNVMGDGYSTRPVGIPFSIAEDNQRAEQLSLVPDPGCAGLRIARTTSLTGHCKDGVQERMLSVEDFYDAERRYYNDTVSLLSRVLERRNPATIGAELKAALAKAREERRKYFDAEVKEWIFPGVTELAQTVIRSAGTRHDDPVFQFSSRFRANELLRPAGSNFLLQIGQLISHLPEVDAANVQRTEDAYLDFANVYAGSYAVRIPEGFTAAGLEALNKDVRNDAGAFHAEASADGKIINISLRLVRNKSIYTATEWPELVAVLQAAGAWKNSKILFRRAS